MIKRSFLIFLLIPYSSFAQFMVGASLSPEIGKLTSASTTSTYGTGYTAAVNVGQFINYNLWLSAGAAYSKKGYHEDKTLTTYRFDYIEIPVLLHYRTGDPGITRSSMSYSKSGESRLGFSAFGGVVPGFIYDAKFSTNSGTETLEKGALKNAGYSSVVSATAGAGVYYQFTQNMFFTVEPNIKYCFTQQPKGSGNHMYTLGINVNIWYHFGVF